MLFEKIHKFIVNPGVRFREGGKMGNGGTGPVG